MPGYLDVPPVRREMRPFALPISLNIHQCRMHHAYSSRCCSISTDFSTGSVPLIPGPGMRICGSGFQVPVSGSGFRVSGSEFRVSGFGFRVSGFGFRVPNFGFGFRVSGFGFRVAGLRCTLGGTRVRRPLARFLRTTPPASGTPAPEYQESLS